MLLIIAVGHEEDLLDRLQSELGGKTPLVKVVSSGSCQQTQREDQAVVVNRP